MASGPRGFFLGLVSVRASYHICPSWMSYGTQISIYVTYFSFRLVHKYGMPLILNSFSPLCHADGTSCIPVQTISAKDAEFILT